MAVANGGTCATTLATNNVLLGNGTSAPLTVAPGASGNVLMSNGTTWASATPTTNWAAPGAIGATTPNSAAFTTLTASGNIGIGTTNPGQKLSVAGTVESTAAGFRFPDGTTQTTAALVKYCSQTGIRSGAAGNYNFTFVAADCGGSLPDTNYKGAAAEVGICNGVATFKVLQPGDANGPGMSIYSNLGPCGGYTMSVLYLRVN